MDDYRFYVPDLRAQAAAGKFVRLPEDQSHHARSVLRLGAGAAVTVFDGLGGWAGARVAGEAGTKVARSAVLLELATAVQVDAPRRPALTLATAVPKGDRADTLVEQASQLGVAHIRWLGVERGVVKPREGGNKIDKWRRLAIESAKQCGRSDLLEIHDLEPLERIVQRAIEEREVILWLEPREGGGSCAIGDALRSPAAERITALIGPEGGWSERERQLLEAAGERRELTQVRLTGTVLRIETACSAVAAIILSAREAPVRGEG